MGSSAGAEVEEGEYCQTPLLARVGFLRRGLQLGRWLLFRKGQVVGVLRRVI